MSKIFVVSLPRTGTTSIIEFLNSIGIKSSHVPSVYFNNLKNEYEAFADTPCFDPCFLQDLVYNEPKTHKFIYIERHVYDWLKSFEQSSLAVQYSEMVTTDILNPVSLMDKRTYGNVFGYDGVYNISKFKQKFIDHRNNIDSILKNEKVFYYKLGSDTTAMLNFLNIDLNNTNNVKFPHLNYSIKIY